MISNYSSKPASLIFPIAIGIAFISVFFIACNSGDTESLEESGQSEAVEEVKADDTEEAVYYMLPSPLQIAHIFRQSGLKYIPDLANDPKNVIKYISETSRLQNLGVYSADLCYMALNEQTQQEILYLKAVIDLSNDLGFSSIFSSGGFVARFEQNVSSKDSMVMMLSELQERMDFYLQDAELEDKSTIIFSGAWIESIYLSLSGYKLEKEESGLSVRIYEQLYILSSLVKKMEAVWEPNEEVKAVIADLNALQDIVENFAFMKDVDKQERVSVKDVSISDEELDQLATKVEEMRTKIING